MRHRGKNEKARDSLVSSEISPLWRWQTCVSQIQEQGFPGDQMTYMMDFNTAMFPFMIPLKQREMTIATKDRDKPKDTAEIAEPTQP